MNPFDVGIIHFVNQFAHRSWILDNAMVLISKNHFLKGGVVAGLIWWIWFHRDEGRAQKREFLLFGIVASFLALVVARVVAATFPFRERPLRNLALNFQMPYEMNDKVLTRWNSFPSDHAVLFFTLAAVIFIVSRRAGILALCHAVFFICIPRIYLGIHYPTDILAGAVIGIAIASLSKIALVRYSLARPCFLWLQKSPGTFYGSLFLVTFQIATLFDSTREIIHFVLLFPKSSLAVSIIVALLLYLLYRVGLFRETPPSTNPAVSDANLNVQLKSVATGSHKK